MRRSDACPPPPGGGRSAAQRPGGGDGGAARDPPPYAGEGQGAGHPSPDHLRWSDPPPAGEGKERLRQVLFSPRSVALIGQSNDPGKTAGRPLKFLRQAGYAGRVYPVNARRREVLGECAWPSLEALPEVPEHAYVVTPIDGVMEAIEACGRAGVAVATVLTDGFAEPPSPPPGR